MAFLDRFYREGDNLVIVDCEGNTKKIPLGTIGQGGDPDPTPVPDTQLCAIAGAAAMVAFNALWELQDILSGQPNNEAGWFAAAAAWILQEHFDSLFFNQAVLLIAEIFTDIQNEPDWTFTTETLPAGIAQEFGCLSYQALVAVNGIQGEGWREAYATLFDNHPADAISTVTGYQTIAKAIRAIPMSYWQSATIAIAGGLGTVEVPPNAYFEIDCETCGDPEVPPAPCLEENLTEVVYMWDASEWVSPNPGCYGSGTWEPCSPFNSLLGDTFELDFTSAPRCIKEIAYGYAGNTQVDSPTQEIYINGVLQATMRNQRSKVACRFSPSRLVLPAVVGNVVSVKIKFIEKIGSNPTFPLNLHCIKLVEATP